MSRTHSRAKPEQAQSFQVHKPIYQIRVHLISLIFQPCLHRFLLLRRRSRRRTRRRSRPRILALLFVAPVVVHPSTRYSGIPRSCPNTHIHSHLPTLTQVWNSDTGEWVNASDDEKLDKKRNKSKSDKNIVALPGLMEQLSQMATQIQELGSQVAELTKNRDA